MLCDQVWQREGMMEIVGKEFKPYLYPQLELVMIDPSHSSVSHLCRRREGTRGATYESITIL